MSEHKVSILLVDRGPDLTEPLAAKLHQTRFVVTSVHDGAAARAQLKSRAFHGLLIDVLMTRTGHLDIITWTRYRQPSMVIVVTSDLKSPALERELLDRGANVVVTKLVAADRLAGYFSGGSQERFSETDAGFDGQKHIDMIEHLDTIMRSGRKTVLEVVSSGCRQGRIFVSEGRVVHAVYGANLGEEALYRCLSLPNGQLLALPWREPTRVTINKPRESLLMEAARRRDGALF